MLLLMTVFYYLVPGTAGHTELRYVLPMHGILIVFAGAAIDRLFSMISGFSKIDRVVSS